MIYVADLTGEGEVHRQADNRPGRCSAKDQPDSEKGRQYPERMCVQPVPRFSERAATMMEENRRPRLRFRLGTLLLIVAIFALLLVVVTQQVQIARQGMEMRQIRKQNDSYVIQQDKLQEIIRTQRDQLNRHG